MILHPYFMESTAYPTMKAAQSQNVLLLQSRAKWADSRLFMDVTSDQTDIVAFQAFILFLQRDHLTILRR